MNRTHVDLISFYITNVCGLACPGCASYNNYVLKGHYNWDDARDRTHKWGELIDVGQITIIGGEPLLHPDINNWVLGVRNAFTHVSDLRILTGLTGSKLTRFKNSAILILCCNTLIQIQI
jgi:MoaA/NifB/PqqE/SkfB family radical SAM enzyme